jgi:hypothetical protein
MEALSTGTSQPTDLSMPQPIQSPVATTDATVTVATSVGVGAPDPILTPGMVITPTDAAGQSVTALPPTSVVSATPVPPTVTPLPTLAVATIPTLTNEERWRAQQIDRVVFDAVRTYRTVGSELWWYDPINQQSLVLGSFSGDFVAQARFTLRGQGIAALEVPYRVNVSYGLTALSPAIRERIQAAGYEEWIETYVFVTPNVTEQ